MNHLPYEDWLFERPEDLTEQQNAELQTHLEDCMHCRNLIASLGVVEHTLRSAPVFSPAAGFTARWQVRLEVERLKAHRRQVALTLGFSLAGLGALLACLALLSWPWLDSLDATFWAGLYQLLGLYAAVQAVSEFFRSLFLAAFDVLPLALIILGFGLISELGVLWVVSYRLLTNPRRLTQ